MLWFLFFVLVIGFGLGMWEFIVIKDAMKRQGTAAATLAMAAETPLHRAYSGLPLALRFPFVRGWIFAGQLGFPIVALAGWWTTTGIFAGFLRSIELELLYIVIGSAIGLGIWRAAGGSAPEQSDEAPY